MFMLILKVIILVEVFLLPILSFTFNRYIRYISSLHSVMPSGPLYLP